MITELPARLGERLSFIDRGADLLLDGVDLLGRRQHRVFVGARNDEHAVGIAAQEIARCDARIADIDGPFIASTWTRSFPVRME